MSHPKEVRMNRWTLTLAVAAPALAVAPATAGAHVSFHPNAIPAGSFATLDVRVPNEETKANITSVRIKLPSGVLDALGSPPAGWKFQAKTKKLAKPVTTDDGTVSTEVTEVDFTGGGTPPSQFFDGSVALDLPDSAKAGDVVGFPTVQTYSDGKVVRWIGPPSADMPAPTLDITAAGTALLDVSGGDAGPPAKLPANLAGPSTGAAVAAPAAGAKPAAVTVVKKEQGKGLGIAALIVAILALLAGLTALGSRRGKAVKPA
jgi:uncharacterized protein YcnI